MLRDDGRAGACSRWFGLETGPSWTLTVSKYASVSPAVLLIMSKKLFKGCIQGLAGFRVVAEHEVNIGGLGGGIYILEKNLAL